MFGKKQIEFAATDKIDRLRPEVDELLVAIAKYMIEPGDSAEEWANSAFVSDESSIFNFLCEKDVDSMRKDLGLLSLSGGDLIWVVAQTMRNMKTKH